jgi:V/A-type H+-transporting ATPase subunit E
MPLYDQVELLCQAIHAQGREEAEAILARARQEAANLVAAAQAQRREVLERTKGEVQAQARLEARSDLDRAELEGKRRVTQAKEALLNEVFAQGMERLMSFRQTPAYREWLRRTLLAALEALEGASFQVAAHPEEANWLTPEFLGQVGQESGRRLNFAPDPDLTPGGFMVVREDGKVRFDETFAAIIERQRESLRAELARRLWEG